MALERNTDSYRRSLATGGTQNARTQMQTFDRFSGTSVEALLLCFYFLSKIRSKPDS